MIEAVVYDPASGEIRRSVTCPADIVALQAADGEAVLQGRADDSTHYVADGALVAYTSEERARKAARPAGPCAWSNATRAWIDLRTLEQRRAERWAQIKAARDAAETAPLVTPYGTFQCDFPVSQTRIANAAQMMQTEAAALQPGLTPTIDFTLADNTVVTLTAGQMVEVALRMGAQIQAAHATGRALRAQLDAATTAEAVDSVHWPA
jgi:hypothetical protein